MAERNPDALPPLWFVRACLVVLYVPCLIWFAFAETFKEIRPVPKRVWWSCRELASGMNFMWRTGRTPEEEEW